MTTRRAWFFVFISLIASSCSQGVLPKPYVNDADNGLVYNAVFQYKTHYVSGLLVLKKEADGYHVALLSKLGPTLMDLVITEDNVIWNKLVDFLDNPILLSAIENDFRILLLTPMQDPKVVNELKDNQYKVRKEIKLKVKLSENRKVIAAETRRFVNLFKSFASYYYIDDDNVPDEICLTHRNIKLKIELNQLRQ